MNMLAQVILKENVVKHVQYLGTSLRVHRILVKRGQDVGVVGLTAELYLAVEILRADDVENPVDLELKEIVLIIETILVLV